jgi:hypothetical protein
MNKVQKIHFQDDVLVTLLDLISGEDVTLDGQT